MLNSLDSNRLITLHWVKAKLRFRVTCTIISLGGILSVLCIIK